MKFKHVGSHPNDLEGGRIVAPGETVDLDAQAQKDDHNAALIDAGTLIEVPSSSSQKRQTTTDKEGDE